ncbi:MAG: pyrroline-5-carboxylate reductase [Firmicutes bacterium]|nr:pyrroline-5-carboxylate reductase [Bacillota bacterium]
MVGLIGCGTMGSAIARGILKKDIISAQEIILFDNIKTKIEEMKKEFNIKEAASLKDLCQQSKIIFLAIKPQDMGELLDNIREYITPNHTVVSIAAGVPTSFIKSKLGARPGPNVIRLMPNTPCVLGEGIIAISASDVPLDIKRNIMTLIEPLGMVIEIKEKYMNAITGLSASGPAFVFFLIEAFADAGVELGLTREQSELLASQTFLGSAKMVLETKQHPARLKNMVSSPGGTASRGLFYLEEGAVKSHIIKAVVNAAKRAAELSESY